MSRTQIQQTKIRRYVIAGCLLTWLITAWIVFAPGAGPRVMPGPLTNQHASLSSDCGKCHVAQIDQVKGITSGFVHSELALSEGKRCGTCHDLGDNAFKPHSMAVSNLTAETEKHQNKESHDAPTLGSRLASPWGLPMSDSKDIACSVCHREHQGRSHDLTEIGDRTCQNCHLDKNDAFPKEHPPLASYPYKRRTRLIFNHQDHQGKHFPEGKIPFDCASCHVNSGSGQMELKPFESSCASCHHHEEQILGAGKMEQGIPWIRAFGIDLETLSAEDIEVGPWPADGADYEDPPTQLTWALLRSNKFYPAAKDDQDLLKDVDLADLSSATESQMKAAARLANSFRQLISSLASDPRKIAQPLLTKNDLQESIARSALRYLDTNAFAAINEAWFPKANDGKSSKVAPQSWGGGGQWRYDAEMLQLTYVPMGHNDKLVEALHTISVSRGSEDLRQELASDDRCFKCHSVDEGPLKKKSINWGVKTEKPNRPFTKFDHAPHLIAAQEESCALCHQLGDKGSYLEFFGPDKLDPSQFASEFQPMTRGSCAQCHQENEPNSSCATCHNYHVGPFDPKLKLAK